jgi:hypothetical protein
VTEVKFLVTPFDGGVRVLKSEKYLQFAETAQVDYRPFALPRKRP